MSDTNETGEYKPDLKNNKSVYLSIVEDDTVFNKFYCEKFAAMKDVDVALVQTHQKVIELSTKGYVCNAALVTTRSADINTAEVLKAYRSHNSYKDIPIFLLVSKNDRNSNYSSLISEFNVTDVFDKKSFSENMLVSALEKSLGKNVDITETEITEGKTYNINHNLGGKVSKDCSYCAVFSLCGNCKYSTLIDYCADCSLCNDCWFSGTLIACRGMFQCGTCILCIAEDKENNITVADIPDDNKSVEFLYKYGKFFDHKIWNKEVSRETYNAVYKVAIRLEALPEYRNGFTRLDFSYTPQDVWMELSRFPDFDRRITEKITGLDLSWLN